MRFDPVQIITAGDMSGNLSSVGLDMNQMAIGSIQAVFTGSPAGTAGAAGAGGGLVGGAGAGGLLYIEEYFK